MMFIHGPRNEANRCHWPVANSSGVPGRDDQRGMISAMSNRTWYSQLFANSFDGGVLLALPHDALGHWDGTGDDYDDVIEQEDQFLFRPLGPSLGLFIGDMDGEG